MERVSEVEGGLVMEGFVSEEEDFELDPLWDREPVEVLEYRGDVVTGVGVGEFWMYWGLFRFICKSYFPHGFQPALHPC